MTNKRISQLPFVGNTGYTATDIIPIVNYLGVTSGTTKHTPLSDLKSYILSGVTSLYEVGSGTDSTQRVGVSNDASGQNSVVSGGFANTTYSTSSFVGGGSRNTIDKIESTNGSVYGSIISGGFSNTISSYSSYYSTCGNTIAGGTCNTTVSSTYNGQTIGGGVLNRTSSDFATVSGGYNNKALSRFSSINGGLNNINFGDSSFIGGGDSNEIGQGAGLSGTILSVKIINYTGIGVSDGVYTSNGTTGSGTGGVFEITFKGNTPQVNAILNGGSNYVVGDSVVLLGSDFTGGSTPGNDITLEVGAVSKAIPGISDVIGGGQLNTITSCFSFIGGGANNTSYDCNFTFIGGGVNNTINSCCSSIAGGDTNVISGCTYGSFIGGGTNNTSIVSINSVINGGFLNTTYNANHSTIGGGQNNTTTNEFSGILGGLCNKIQHDCSFIVGSGICTTATNTTHVNCLHISNIPTSSVGLAPGTVWSDSGKLCIV